MKKHIWKKSFSISFVFHFIVVITIGAMVAGFHQEIQRPKEELITVNLADTPEQIAKVQEKSFLMSSFIQNLMVVFLFLITLKIIFDFITYRHMKSWHFS